MKQTKDLMKQQQAGTPTQPVSIATTQDQLDERIREQSRLGKRREELATVIAEKDAAIDRLAEAIVSGSEVARTQSREARREIADGAAEVDAIDRVLARLETQITELSAKRSAEVQEEQRAQMIEIVGQVETQMVADLAAFMKAYDEMLTTTGRLSASVKQLREWTGASTGSDASTRAIATRSTWPTIRSAHREAFEAFKAKHGHWPTIRERQEVAYALLTEGGIFA